MYRFNKQIVEAVKRGLQRGLNLSVNDFDLDDDLDNLDNQPGYIKKQIKNKSTLDMLFDDISIQADNLQFSESILKYVNQLKNYNKKYIVKTRDQLDKIIEAVCKVYPKADLNWLDVSNITDMSNLFQGQFFENGRHIFNGDISEWDVSNVENMHGVFYWSGFNGDISKWDVSNVKDMSYMFYRSIFTGDISNWDVSSVNNMRSMFAGSNVKCDITKWDVSSVRDVCFMFKNATFNFDLSKLNINPTCDKFRITE